ncbi:MAG: AAA family ATPase [Candidatus Zixiibacteriota bacterium]
MLVRFVAKNVLSFGDETELFMGARPERNLRDEHIYDVCGLELMKMVAVYGANASGKSNLVKAISFLRDLIFDKAALEQWNRYRFRFAGEDESSVLAIEFIEDNVPFIYIIEIKNDLIKKEELYISALGQKGQNDNLIYRRLTDDGKKSKLQFSEEFEKEEGTDLLKDVLIKNIIKPDRTILEFVSESDQLEFAEAKNAVNWFRNTLQVISPEARYSKLIKRLESDIPFSEFLKKNICQSDIGIDSFDIHNVSVSEIESESNDLNKIRQVFEENQDIDSIPLPNRDSIVYVREEGKLVIKWLQFDHKGGAEEIIRPFFLHEESDGTKRLIDLLPAFYFLMNNVNVLLIDEIERSIHPNLIKALIAKFSHTKDTKGQLIFTTHESNLLDQNILRRDEVWFTEKNKKGMTELYSLGEFKDVHKTNNIQKGYLSGRYEAVPYTKNLGKIDWKSYAR